MSDTRKRIGSQIQDRRSRLGWTTKDVALRIGRQPSRVSETETGKANSTLDSIADMAAIMGLSLVLVPTERLADVMALSHPADNKAAAPATHISVFDEVFIADPDDDDEATDH